MLNSQLKNKMATRAIKSPKKLSNFSSQSEPFKNFPGSLALDDGDLLLTEEDSPGMQQ